MWRVFEDGKTIGSEGLEKGRIIKDEEHLNGARITLEEGCGSIHFAITCGIYGLMVHTAFASDIAEALQKYENMQKEIDGTLKDEDNDGDTLTEWIEQFVNRYS